MNFRGIVSVSVLLTVIFLFVGLSEGTKNTEASGTLVNSATPMATASPKPDPCSPSSPNELFAYLDRTINNKPEPKPNCKDKWIIQNDPDFSHWDSGGSYNLPVVSATVGLYRGPTTIMATKKPPSYKINYVDWWIWFLASQTGQDPRSYDHTGPFAAAMP
jgi:hypothetical protein